MYFVFVRSAKTKTQNAVYFSLGFENIFKNFEYVLVVNVILGPHKKAQ